MPFTVAICSPKPGTGKTTSAVFLAESIRARGADVLLVDADKGDSALRWSELAGSLSYPVVAMQVTDLHRKLPAVANGRDAVVIDVPQVEDHRRIAKGALRYADLWLLPVAPAGIEVDRMMGGDIREFLAEVGAERDDDGQAPASTVVVLNRTNRAVSTRTGPDADVREVLTSLGWTVATAQIPHGDERYRQPFGCPIEVDVHYDALLTELLALTGKDAPR
jgi:chromosome partitioning protein